MLILAVQLIMLSMATKQFLINRSLKTLSLFAFNLGILRRWVSLYGYKPTKIIGSSRFLISPTNNRRGNHNRIGNSFILTDHLIKSDFIITFLFKLLNRIFSSMCITASIGCRDTFLAYIHGINKLTIHIKRYSTIPVTFS